MKRWLSLHIFYHDITKQEKLITKCIYPLFKEIRDYDYVHSYFFMRYWDGGPHLRLRFYIDESKYSHLESFIRNYINKYLNVHPSLVNLNSKDYYRNLLVGEEMTEIRKIYADNSIENLEYEQEYNRYGGREGIKIAQELFMLSSELSCAILSKFDSYQKRLSVAKDLMFITFHSYSKHDLDAIEYFEQYSRYYKVYISDEETIQNFVENADKTFKKSMDIYKRQVGELKKKLGESTEKKDGYYHLWFCAHQDAFKSLTELYKNGKLVNPLTGKKVVDNADLKKSLQLIAQSYMHMNNNRLGINFYNESYLAYILRNSL